MDSPTSYGDHLPVWLAIGSKEIKRPGILALIVLVLLACGFISTIISNLIRMKKNATDYVLEINEERILINQGFYCNRENLDSIIIQGSNGWDGVGVSYVIGLASKGTFFPLSFYQNLRNAKIIADQLSIFLSSNIVIKESKFFSLFKGY